MGPQPLRSMKPQPRKLKCGTSHECSSGAFPQSLIVQKVSSLQPTYGNSGGQIGLNLVRTVETIWGYDVGCFVLVEIAGLAWLSAKVCIYCLGTLRRRESMPESAAVSKSIPAGSVIPVLLALCMLNPCEAELQAAVPQGKVLGTERSVDFTRSRTNWVPARVGQLLLIEDRLRNLALSRAIVQLA